MVRQINDWNYVDVLLAIGKGKKKKKKIYFKDFPDMSTYLTVIQRKEKNWN